MKTQSDGHLKDAVIAITGGTGSFGNAMVNHLLDNSPEVNEIRVLSRDETKQDEMRKKFDSEKIKFFICDVRDKHSLQFPLTGVSHIFHAAALKQVPTCEFFPEQAIMTNIQGSMNIIETAVDLEIKRLVCLSTDKAVYPINAMGMTKALMEKIAYSHSRKIGKSKTIISVTRYGNVMMSRGSVIPLFLKQIESRMPLTVTDAKMTRFMMSLQESVDLVLHAFQYANPGDLFVKKAPAASVETLLDSLKAIFQSKGLSIKAIGIRHGEKLNETLISSEEYSRAQDMGDFFRVPLDTSKINYDYSLRNTDAIYKFKENEGYTSDNTTQLTAHELRQLLMALPDFQKYK
jgi:UDP-glucose 4-epimerase